jgi:hypothetical protein
VVVDPTVPMVRIDERSDARLTGSALIIGRGCPTPSRAGRTMIEAGIALEVALKPQLAALRERQDLRGDGTRIAAGTMPRRRCHAWMPGAAAGGPMRHPEYQPQQRRSPVSDRSLTYKPSPPTGVPPLPFGFRSKVPF